MSKGRFESRAKIIFIFLFKILLIHKIFLELTNKFTVLSLISCSLNDWIFIFFEILFFLSFLCFLSLSRLIPWIFAFSLLSFCFSRVCYLLSILFFNKHLFFLLMLLIFCKSYLSCFSFKMPLQILSVLINFIGIS